MVIVRARAANIQPYFLKVRSRAFTSSPSAVAADSKASPRSAGDVTFASAANLEGFSSVVDSLILSMSEDEESSRNSLTDDMLLVFSQSKLAGRHKESPMERIPPEMIAAALPAKDTHWSLSVRTVMEPPSPLAVASQTMSAMAIPPSDPTTAPALLRSFHLHKWS